MKQRSKEEVEKSATLAWFCGGALFMATVCAPIAGAVASMAWTMQAHMSDGWGDDTLAAQRVVAGLNENWGLPRFYPFRLAIWSRPDTGDKRDCNILLKPRYMELITNGHRAVAHLFGAMIRDEQAMDKADADRASVAAFDGLPRMALGALAQCMDHSLLAGACTLWARHYLSANKQIQTNIAKSLLANARDADDQACVLLEVVKGFGASSAKDRIGR